MLVDTIEDKKGSNIVLLDLKEHNVFADYFLICDGSNERQLRALADNIAFDAKQKANIQTLGIEGDSSAGWVLIDFGDLVVHVFAPEKRIYYSLEEIWDRAHVVMRMQ